MIFLLVAIPLLLFSTTCTAARAYQPTGDELYDRFARLVLDRFAEHGYHLQVPGDYNYELWSWEHEPPELDLSAIVDWEADFGDDPRYWQLRAVCGLDDWQTTTQDGDEWTVSYDSIYTRQADAGICDSATFTILPLRSMLELDEWEDRALGYLDQAVAVDPGNAYWYYKRADASLYLGEAEQAWDYVRAGNAAPRNECVTPFPLSTLFDPGYAGPARDNRIVAGVVYRLALVNLPNFIRIKERFKDVCVCTALGTPLQMADDWLTVARRIGQAEGAGVAYPFVGASCANVLVEYITSQCLEVPAVDQDRLESLQRLEETIHFRTPNVFEDYGELYAPGMVATDYSGALAEYGKLDTKYRSDGPVRDYEAARAVVVPDMSAQDWVNYALISEYEQYLVQELSAELDVYDPPPFVAWAEYEAWAPAAE